MIIHLNGMPGVGKFTAAKLLAEKLNARSIDNHLIIDLVLNLCERGSVEYIGLIKKITSVILAEIAETPSKIFIFTNALAEDLIEDRERFDQIRCFAEKNNIPFVQILLNCDLEENKRRIVSENRKSKGKLMNADELEKLRKYTIYHPPTEFSLIIDTTNLSADDVSDQIKNYIEKINKT